MVTTHQDRSRVERPAPPEFVHVNARWAGTCQTSGIYFPVGRPIAYYGRSRKAHILMGVTAEHHPFNENPKSPVFQYIEGAFDKWLGEQQPGTKELYERGDLNRKGAILQALSDAEDLAHETGCRVWLHECDLTSSFVG